MIRIYLDWNIISNLKRPENKEIKDFIDKHKSYFLFPYSPAHFKDLMKSYTPNNKYFEQDLKTLEYLSGKHLIQWEENGTVPLFRTPKEYFEDEKDKDDYYTVDIEKILNDLSVESELGKTLKSLYKLLPAGIVADEENKEIFQQIFPNITPTSNIWDLMKDAGDFMQKLLNNRDFYKDYRRLLEKKGFKIDANSGNWEENEVIEKINTYLVNLGIGADFLQFIESTFKYRDKPVNKYEFFIISYLVLDIIGYKSDKLPKLTDNMRNIYADSEHAFYGAHCDFFIVGDKNLHVKSKVLYSQFNIPTHVLAPNEFIEVITNQIHNFPKGQTNVIEDAFSYIKLENQVEYYPFSSENEAEIYTVKLPVFYFNFFNYAVYANYKNSQGIGLTFKRVFKNYSNFFYYTEVERIVDLITDLFGYEDKEELEKKKKKFIYKTDDTQFTWHFKYGMIILENDSETKQPSITYLISYKDVKNDESF